MQKRRLADRQRFGGWGLGPWLWLWLGLAVLGGGMSCQGGTGPTDGGSTEKTAEAQPDSLEKGVAVKAGSNVVEKVEPWALRLLRGGAEVSRLPLDGLQIAVVDTYEETYNYDPYWFYEIDGKASIPPGFSWLSPKTAKVIESSEAKAVIEIAYPQDFALILEIEARPEGHRLSWKPKTPDERLILFRLLLPVGKKENFYGLGEYFDQAAHRGKIRAMQIEIDLKLQSGYNEAHIPVPFFTSTEGWGLFVASYRPATFDMAKTDPDRLDIRVHDKDLTFHWFAAPEPLAIPGLYTRLTGAPAIPARWAFGTLLWRDEHKDQAEVLDDAAQIRTHDLAISAMWIDRPYDTAVNNFGFDTSRYPDAAGMIRRLNDAGFRVGVWSTPYVEPKAAKHTFVKDQGWFVKMGFPKLNGWSDPLDFTNPAAFDFWKTEIRKIRALGIEGFKLDYGEDIQVGVRSLRARYGFHSGEDERTMHHKYALFYHKAYAETLGKDGGFLICRGSTWGGQVYASIIWPGDLNTGFQTHYQIDPSRPTAYVGGLPAAIVGALSLSQSGFPFYGADTGGYRDNRPSKEEFIRWGQFTAFSAIMQIGGPDPNVNPWDFTKYGSSQFDTQVLENFRRYIRLHTRLFPTLYTYARAAAEHKPGPLRPFGLAFPREEHHPSDLYLIGDSLLVAPIVAASNQRSIRIPEGTAWIDAWDQALHKGRKDLAYDAPLDRLPFFLKVGSIHPLLRPTIDTLAPSVDPAIQSFAREPGLLYAWLVPGADASFEVYDQTSLAIKDSQKTGFSVVVQPGQEFKQGFVFEIFRLKAEPSRLSFEGKDVSKVTESSVFDACQGACFRWDATDGKLWLRLPATGGAASIQAELRE